MPFEKFVPPRKQRPPQVSIKRTGTISFDTSSAAAFGLDKVGHVTLYFDPARKLVGVKGTTDPKEEGAIKLSHRKRVSSVRAHPFFENYGIPLERTARFPLTADRESGMAVIELGEVKRKRGPRKRQK